MSKTQPRLRLASRLALGAVVLIVGFFSVGTTLANVVVKLDPAQAYRLSPADGRIAALLASARFTQGQDADPNGRLSSLAQNALFAEATATDALVVLAFQAQLRGETAKSDRLFEYSARLSRRELSPQLWGIEDAAERGDIEDALRHYDIALRTSRTARGMLYPVLVSALEEPEIRRRLLEVLRKQPDWRQNFVLYAGTSGVAPAATAQLFAEGRRINLVISDAINSQLVDTLVRGGEFDQAWAYYTTFRPDAERSRARPLDGDLGEDGRSAFDWKPGDDPALSASILRDGDQSVLDFSVPTGFGGVLLEQTQFMRPGRYTLRGKISDLDLDTRSTPYWSLTCLGGTEIGRQAVSGSNEGEWLRFTGTFTVPDSCRTQTLKLVLRPSNKVGGLDGRVAEVSLQPSTIEER